MAQAPEKVYEAIWAQTAKLLAAESFSIALCGPGPNQISYEFVVDRGVRQVPQIRELGDGLSDLVVRTGKSLLVDSFQLEEGSYPLSWMGAPMLLSDNVLGLVTVQCYREAAHDRGDLAVLGMLATWAALAIESERSYRVQQQEAESSAALLRVTRALAAETEESSLLRSMVEIVPAVVECDRCTTWWWVSETGRFEPAWRASPSNPKAEAFSSAPLIPEGIPAIRLLLETKDVVAVGDAGGGQLGTLRDLISMELQSVALVPLMTEGELVGLLAVVRALDGSGFSSREVDLLRALADITSLAMQNLRHHRQKGEAAALRELNEMKSRLIATISHELRTPLSFVQAGSELLMQRLLDPEQLRQVAGLVNQGSVRLAEIVDDIILFADLQSGGIALSPEPTDPAALLRDALDDLLGPGERNRVRLEAPESTPVVRVDSDRLKSIAIRLLRNALTFSQDDSPVVVRVSVPPDQLQIVVSDSGLGIPKEEVNRVFEPFFRGEASQARCIPGTGLGLSIVKQLVAAMGGDVSMASEPGRGTSVTVSVPVTLASADTDPGAQEGQPDQGISLEGIRWGSGAVVGEGHPSP